MALAHTILTLLLEKPYSGYDISKCFEDGISCYWNASQQQIYRELTKIEKEGEDWKRKIRICAIGSKTTQVKWRSPYLTSMIVDRHIFSSCSRYEFRW